MVSVKTTLPGGDVVYKQCGNGNVTPCDRHNLAAPAGFFAAVHADHPVHPLSSCADVEEFNFFHSDVEESNTLSRWEPLIRFVAVVGILTCLGYLAGSSGVVSVNGSSTPLQHTGTFRWPNGTAYGSEASNHWFALPALGDAWCPPPVLDVATLARTKKLYSVPDRTVPDTQRVGSFATHTCVGAARTGDTRHRHTTVHECVTMLWACVAGVLSSASAAPYGFVTGAFMTNLGITGADATFVANPVWATAGIPGADTIVPPGWTACLTSAAEAATGVMHTLSEGHAGWMLVVLSFALMIALAVLLVARRRSSQCDTGSWTRRTVTSYSYYLRPSTASGLMSVAYDQSG